MRGEDVCIMPIRMRTVPCSLMKTIQFSTYSKNSHCRGFDLRMTKTRFAYAFCVMECWYYSLTRGAVQEHLVWQGLVADLSSKALAWLLPLPFILRWLIMTMKRVWLRKRQARLFAILSCHISLLMVRRMRREGFFSLRQCSQWIGSFIINRNVTS